MLSSVLADQLEKSDCSNEPIFDTVFDFADNKMKYDNAAKQYNKLEKAEQKTVKFDQFVTRNGVVNPKSDHLIPAKNFYLMQSEARRRIDEGVLLQRMAIDSMDFERSTLELAESAENTDLIRELYRFRKRTCGQGSKDGISHEEASKLRHCFVQGRELYSAGLTGGLLVKPLNFFYALTAYTYGLIVLNNPLRFHKGMLPGSHSMNYLPNDVTVQFGGDVPRGTFSDLVASFPTHAVIGGDAAEFHIDASESIVQYHQTKHTATIGTLLSLLPEMSEFYRLATNRPSRAHPLEITQSSNRRSVEWQFRIGNGETKPNGESVRQSFPGFQIGESYGRTTVNVPADQAHTIRAMIYSDIRGKLLILPH